MKKIDEKWIKNQPKINQKWTKHEANISQNRGLEGKCNNVVMWQRKKPKTFKNRALGAPKSRSGGAKWRSGGANMEVWRAPARVQNAFWVILSAETNFWSFLKGSWGRFVAKKWPTWAQLGPQEGATINGKWGRKSINFSMPFGIDF